MPRPAMRKGLPRTCCHAVPVAKCLFLLSTTHKNRVNDYRLWQNFSSARTLDCICLVFLAECALRQTCSFQILIRRILWRRLKTSISKRATASAIAHTVSRSPSSANSYSSPIAHSARSDLLTTFHTSSPIRSHSLSSRSLAAAVKSRRN